MAGLLRPIVGHATTQGFEGDDPHEPAGFVASDGSGARRARRTAFPGAVERTHLHGAIDIGCPIGTPVRAPEAGTVMVRDLYPSGERYLMLQVRPGTILFFTHLSSWTAAEGERVSRGQEIARSGNTGPFTTGPHLHWEVRVTFRPHPRPRRSSHWFKWNPARLMVGADLAELGIIRPLAPPGVAASAAADSAGAVGSSAPAASAAGDSAAPGAPAAPTADPVPADDLADDPPDAPDDQVGDEADLAVPLVDASHTPEPF